MGNEGDRLLELRITSNLGLRREINESNNARLALLLLSVGTIRTLDLPPCHISKFIWGVSYTQVEGFPRGKSKFSKKSAGQTNAVKVAASLTGRTGRE